MIPIDPNRIKEEGVKLKEEVRAKTLGYVMGALGLVAGLAWNDAVLSLIKEFFPEGVGGVIAKFGYAVIVTIIVVILGVFLSRFFERKNRE